MSIDLIPAIEAAARGWFDRQQARRMDPGRHHDDGTPWQWEDLPPTDRRAFLAIAQPVVTAAAPHIEAAVRQSLADRDPRREARRRPVHHRTRSLRRARARRTNREERVMSALTERLDEWAALAEGATPGPWGIDGPWLGVSDGEGRYRDVARTSGDAGDANAAFISESRAALPALVEALRAVLALHEPRSFWISNPDDWRMWRTRDEADEHKRADVIEPEEVTLCEACMRTAYEYDDGETVSENGYGASADWPCPDVRVIATALGVTP